MPAGKRQQSDTMLYTLIIFVALFIIATTVAVIYYVKFEEQRDIADESQMELNRVILPQEQRKGLGKIVGTIRPGKSGLGTMVKYLDEMVSLIVGGLPEDKAAQAKVGDAGRQAKDMLMLSQSYIDIQTIDPNTIGLTRIIEKLKIKLDNVTTMARNTQAALDDLQKRYEDANRRTYEKEQILLAEKDKYQQQVNDIKQDYAELKALMKKNTGQQVQTLIDDLNQEKAVSRNTHQELLKTQAELKMAQDRMELVLKDLQKIVPLPDNEVAAYKSDGKIILIDDQAGIVHINIGSDDRVYPGLTFSIYDKNVPIPKDGKGKAEIEVFKVGKNLSAARIIRSEIKKPIVLDDIVANLIWDSDKINVFAVSGEFDLDNDGNIDSDAPYKIKVLVEKWGGKVTGTISIDTDFLVLGSQPSVLRRPTFEEIEVDPTAMDKYEASSKKFAHYNETQNRSQALSIPVFNYERFLFLIGYKTQAGRAGAF